MREFGEMEKRRKRRRGRRKGSRWRQRKNKMDIWKMAENKENITGVETKEIKKFLKMKKGNDIKQRSKMEERDEGTGKSKTLCETLKTKNTKYEVKCQGQEYFKEKKETWNNN